MRPSEPRAGDVEPASRILNIPNFITLLRIIAIPVYLIFLIDQEIGPALVVFLIAGVTDSLDGAVARLTNSRTTLGAYLDPLADKALIMSSFITLAFLDVVPTWLTVIVLSRDILIMSGYLVLFLMTQELMEIRPSLASKATTFLHLSSVSVALLSLWSPNLLSASFNRGLYFVTAILTVVSGTQYAVRALRWYDVQSRLVEKAPLPQPPAAP